MSRNEYLVAFAEKSIENIYTESEILPDIGTLNRRIIKAWRTDTSR